MTRAFLFAALAPFLWSASAQATVEKKFSYRGEDAYAYFVQTEGCRITTVNVLSHDIRQKLAAAQGMDKVVDKFSVVSVEIDDLCTGNVLFLGYSDSTPEQSTHTRVFDPEHDRVTLNARLIMEDDGSFTFYWATINLAWTLSDASTPFDFKDFFDSGDGVTFIRLRGKGEMRPTTAAGALSIVPYFPEITVPAIGAGVSLSLDSSTTPPEYSDLNFYFKQQSSERIVYREHFYQGQP